LWIFDARRRDVHRLLSVERSPSIGPPLKNDRGGWHEVRSDRRLRVTDWKVFVDGEPMGYDSTWVAD
jgi:hypothetical protein